MKVHILPLNVWPVLQRELREGARRPVNRRLRLMSAGVGTLLIWLVVANQDQSSSDLGPQLLAALHCLMLGLICLVVPALAADCIAREKRDQTLGLLFLTPLNAGGIVAGKALAQALRAFTLWLAMLPILALPFLLGGITWFNAFSDLSLEFCVAVLCLAAGLLASSLARERGAAFLLAFILGAIFVFLFVQLFVFISFPHILAHILASLSWPMNRADELGWWIAALEINLLSGLGNNPRRTLWLARAGAGPTWLSFCLVTLVALLIFIVIARFAAFRINRSWQQRVPSLRAEKLRQRYCTPFFGQWFRRKMQRILDRNPIAWLQEYSWKARAGKWGLCLAYLAIAYTTVKLSHGDLQIVATVLGGLLLILAGIYTFDGVSGFLEEKRSGALELLLVTPISVNKLIFGRAFGLLGRFLPAFIVLNVFAMHFETGDGLRLSGTWQTELILVCGFVALPIFATYFALRVKNLIVASVLTWIALLLPLAFVQEACAMFDAFWDWQVPPDLWGFALCLSYAAFVLLTCFLLRHSLSRRIYSF